MIKFVNRLDNRTVYSCVRERSVYNGSMKSKINVVIFENKLSFIMLFRKYFKFDHNIKPTFKH